MSTLAIIGITIAGIVVLFLIFNLVLGFYLYCISVKRNALFGRMVGKYLDGHLSDYKIDRTWWDSQNIKELKIKVGKEKLIGHLIENEKKSNKVAIVVHGYCGTHKDLNAQAEIFLKNRFNVFAPDLRAHGKSTGRTIGMGTLDKDDMKLWINKMIEIFGKKTEIVLFGLSMGGATVCLVSGEDLPTNVRCIVSDCAYDDAYDQFKHILKEKVKLPEFPLMKLASIFIKLIGKYDLKEVSPKKAVAKSKLPILFIHGEADDFVPAYMVEELYKASDKSKCEIYIVKGANHAKSFAAAPEIYEEKMMQFVNKYIN